MPVAKRPAKAAVPEAAADDVPRDAKLRQAMKVLGDYADPILKTLLVIGVFLGGYEYLHRQQSTRVEESLALVDEWKSDGHRDAYQRINDLVWPLYAQAAPLIEAAASDQTQVAMIFGNPLTYSVL